MNRSIKLRLGAFVGAITVIVALIAWVASTSWQRTGELRERLSAVQLQSFRIADHFQQSILELNNLLLRYSVSRNTPEWLQFETGRTNLDHWIDEQLPILQTEKEKQILDRINNSYDDYMAAALQIGDRVRAESPGQPGLVDLAEFEKQSQNVLSLGFELARAHRESMDSFLVGFSRSLTWLRYLLLGCLALLLPAVGGLAAVVYRELIAPLRLKLVENQALIERQEKLASLGMLAAGVAHEIRNPLTAIKAWLFIQQKDLRPGSQEQADAAIISSEISRLERIVKDVLLFARPSEPHLARVQAAEVLRRVRNLMAPELEKKGITLKLDDLGASAVRVDPHQIQQVLINLISNAAESITRQGTITLRARNDVSRLNDTLADTVVLEVADTGKGIPPDVEKRLFDPFFTTKETGTGLGLSIAARIVEKHGGALQYQTKVNYGTTFGVVLPRAP
ncbi:MAG TPA: ATP-binding protein [Verrucomicrobiae bacterium]